MNVTRSLSEWLPLFRNLVRRDVRQRYKGSALGLAWALINPALVVLAYWVVFKFLFGTPIPNYALFLFVGLMAWALFYGGIVVASQSLVANASLITKVRFPRQLIPLSAISGNAVIAAAMLVIALPLCLVIADGAAAPLIALPAFLLLLTILTVGLGLALSILNVYFRDVEHVLAALGVPWFFLTPIFYTYDSLPSGAANAGILVDVLHWGNPVSPFVIAIQDTLFFGTWPSLGDTIYCVVAAAAMLTIGIMVFRSLEREIAVEL